MLYSGGANVTTWLKDQFFLGGSQRSYQSRYGNEYSCPISNTTSNSPPWQIPLTLPKFNGVIFTAQCTTSNSFPQNLLVNSDNLSVSPWEPQAATATFNAGIDPNGTYTATSLIESNTNNSHPVLQRKIPCGGQVQVFTSIAAKPNGRNNLNIRVIDTQGTAAGYNQFFDVLNGVVGSATVVNPGFSNPIATITALANGFYRCSFLVTTNANSTSLIIAYELSTGGTTRAYTGDGVSGLFLSQAQFANNVLGAVAYVPTTFNPLVDTYQSSQVVKMIDATRKTLSTSTGHLRKSVRLIRKVIASGTGHIIKALRKTSLYVTTSYPRVHKRVGERFQTMCVLIPRKTVRVSVSLRAYGISTAYSIKGIIKSAFIYVSTTTAFFNRKKILLRTFKALSASSAHFHRIVQLVHTGMDVIIIFATRLIEAILRVVVINEDRVAIDASPQLQVNALDVVLEETMNVSNLEIVGVDITASPELQANIVQMLNSDNNEENISIGSIDEIVVQLE